MWCMAVGAVIYWRMLLRAFSRGATEAGFVEALIAIIFVAVVAFFMIALTLVLLPRLNDDRQLRSDEPKRVTEEIHIKPKMRK